MVQIVAAIVAMTAAEIGVETASILADAAAGDVLAAAAVADTVDAAVAVFARAAVTFLHRSTLRLRAKIAAVTVARIVGQTAEAIAAVVDIRIEVATRAVVRGAISIIAVPTLRVLPLQRILPKNRLYCRASRWPNIANVRCR